MHDHAFESIDPAHLDQVSGGNLGEILLGVGRGALSGGLHGLVDGIFSGQDPLKSALAGGLQGAASAGASAILGS